MLPVSFEYLEWICVTHYYHDIALSMASQFGSRQTTTEGNRFSIIFSFPAVVLLTSLLVNRAILNISRKKKHNNLTSIIISFGWDQVGVFIVTGKIISTVSKGHSFMRNAWDTAYGCPKRNWFQFKKSNKNNKKKRTWIEFRKHRNPCWFLIELSLKKRKKRRIH